MNVSRSDGCVFKSIMRFDTSSESGSEEGVSSRLTQCPRISTHPVAENTPTKVATSQADCSIT